MKKISLLVFCLLSAVLLIVSCGGHHDTLTSTARTTETAVTSTNAAQRISVATTNVQTTAVVTAQTTVGTLQLIDGEKPVFQVVSSLDLFKNSFFNKKIDDFCLAFRDIGVTIPTYTYDQGRKMTYEILIGKTNRDVKLPELDALEWVVMVQGTKVILYSETDYGLLDAIEYFTKTHLNGCDGELTLPTNFYKVGRYDPLQSIEHGKTYAEMASEVWDAFNAEFWDRTHVTGIGFWESAEVIEIYADAYELTHDEAIKEKLLAYADHFVRAYKRDWLWKIHNDSPMWASIAFCRITLLTGERKYYEIAKENFDAVYARSYDQTLGGGLWWDVDKTTKDACVNGPAAIAACYIAEISGDDSYYEKAKDLMAWMFDTLFDKNTGDVYGRYDLNDGILGRSSTYNHGTFIGACTLLYQHYQDEIYLTYAKKAVACALIRLPESVFGVLDNNENHDGAMIGFKGIFARWARYYIVETDDMNLFVFLQHNADVAYGNRNENGLIWTNWHLKTPTDPVAEKHNAFSMSTAVSLLINCQLWK